MLVTLFTEKFFSMRLSFKMEQVTRKSGTFSAEGKVSKGAGKMNQ